ncbi:DUF2487 family protein [Brevibacillus sp. H7]|uniref:DUF2487 family protein n=1 Tax=Brevibacillus sp. H7 TaxID=3349138 RepID=UPI003819D619
MQWNMTELCKWEELREFVDTALLPLYLFRPGVNVDQHANRMTYLVNVASAIEQRLKGRVLLFPLCYQIGSVPVVQRLPEGFSHYVLLQFSGDHISCAQDQPSPLYLAVGDEDLDSALRFEVTVDVLYQEILRMWQQRKDR